MGKVGEDGGGRYVRRRGIEESGCLLRARRAAKHVEAQSLEGSLKM